MGFMKNLVMKQLTGKILKQVAPYFAGNTINIKVFVDKEITTDYSNIITDAMKPFQSIIKNIELVGFIVPKKCWNERRRQHNILDLITVKREGLELYIIKRDIFASHLNWAYGITSPVNGVCIVSIARFSDSETTQALHMTFLDEETRKQLTLEIQHEIGHLLGLIDHPEGQHVGNCTMNQTMHMENPEETNIRVGDSGQHISTIFCPACSAWLEQFADALKNRNLQSYAERVAKMIVGE